MMTVILVTLVDDEMFHRSKLGAIWGTIYFQIDNDKFFPGQGWTDLSAAFARVWLEATLQFANATMDKKRVPFFDGPLAVDISAKSDGYVCLDFIHKDAVKVTTTAKIQDLLENALAVGSLLLQNCRARGWSNSDTEALEALTERGYRTLPS
jgi:hypothetical protein